MAVIIAVSMVSAIGGLVFNTMPILLGASGEAFSLSPAQLGTLSLTAGIGYLIGTLSGPTELIGAWLHSELSWLLLSHS